MPFSKYLFLWLMSLIVFTSCQPDVPVDFSNDYVFTHANVIPMDQEEILEDQHVWIRQGKIHKIAPANSLTLPDDINKIDAKGKYLFPGLAEMHAHIPVPRGPEDSLVYETLFLYLANGITTIRGMLGDPFHVQLKERVKNEELLSPRIYTSGTSINGNSCPNIAIADSMVRAHKAAGYDFLKLHPGLKKTVFDQIVATANEVAIPFAGHVSLDVGIQHALENEYGSVDHIDGYVEGLVPQDAGLPKDANGFFGFAFTDVADQSMIPTLASMTKEHQVAVVPTQSMIARWTSPVSPDSMLSQPEMKYMNPTTLQRWREAQIAIQNTSYYSTERYERFINLRREIIHALHQEGVLLLLGSDAPQIYNVPGFSIHREIKAVQEAGLTMYETLQTGTLNPAIYFDQEGQWGTLIEGASADLMLLPSNPLENLDILKNHEGVMFRGTWLSRSEIDSRLASIADNYQN